MDDGKPKLLDQLRQQAAAGIAFGIDGVRRKVRCADPDLLLGTRRCGQPRHREHRQGEHDLWQ